MFAVAVDGFRQWRAGMLIALAGFAMVANVALRDVAGAARKGMTLRVIEWEALNTFPAHSHRVAVLIASPKPNGGLARSRRRTGNSELSGPFPLVHAVTCDAASRALAERRDLLIVRYFDSRAQLQPAGAQVIDRFTRNLSIGTRARRSRIGIELIAPAAGAAP